MSGIDFYGEDDLFGHLHGPELDKDGKARAGGALEDGVTVAADNLVIDAMREVYDPEIPVNIYELGLIYKYAIDAAGSVDIQMTLTAPGCPVAGVLPGHLARTVSEVDGVGEVVVELVWDPPWSMDMMSEAAKVELNMF